MSKINHKINGFAKLFYTGKKLKKKISEFQGGKFLNYLENEMFCNTFGK